MFQLSAPTRKLRHAAALEGDISARDMMVPLTPLRRVIGRHWDTSTDELVISTRRRPPGPLHFTLQPEEFYALLESPAPNVAGGPWRQLAK